MAKQFQVQVQYVNKKRNHVLKTNLIQTFNFTIKNLDKIQLKSMFSKHTHTAKNVVERQ